ncbi:response regulator transcription factor [Ruminococcaceae bacterium OttesenSCG-928-L11]|nr:response regulator transcription factor [Ruminococcaceae bacterium OttesenSCG-928-L11]
MRNALRELPQKPYSLIVVLSRRSFGELLSIIAQLNATTSLPILVLAEKYIGIDKITAIHRGADEYLPIPENISEAAASGLSLIRRHNTDESHRANTIICGELKIDVGFRKVYVNEQVALTGNSEFEFLYLLSKNIGRTFSPEYIYQHIHGSDREIINTRNAISSLVKRIRKKLKKASASTEIIQTVWMEGYRINAG